MDSRSNTYIPVGDKNPQEIFEFLDGIGRMCRLVLNAILLRCAGIVGCLGENGKSREEYLAMQRRGSTWKDLWYLLPWFSRSLWVDTEL